MGSGTMCICNLGDYRIAYARLTPPYFTVVLMPSMSRSNALYDS